MGYSLIDFFHDYIKEDGDFDSFLNKIKEGCDENIRVKEKLKVFILQLFEVFGKEVELEIIGAACEGVRRKMEWDECLFYGVFYDNGAMLALGEIPDGMTITLKKPDEV